MANSSSASASAASLVGQMAPVLPPALVMEEPAAASLVAQMALVLPPALVMEEPAAAAAAGATRAALYVGDLEASVEEGRLSALFCRVAPVESLRLCRDAAGNSLGYAYVNFHSQEDAARALQVLNFTTLNGKSIRVMFSNRDPTVRTSGRANLFVKNLEPNINNKGLNDMFSSFGAILSCKVATHFNGQSKGHGFVQFATEESANDAISSLNGKLVNGREIFVGLLVRRQETQRNEDDTSKFTNVYIKNLPKDFTDDDLRREFAPFGEITSAVVMKDADGKSKCFGFVNFEKPECAAEAVEKLNGKTVSDMVLYVGRAQRKAERVAELKTKFAHEKDGKLEKFPGLNLYLKNLDEIIDDKFLRELFEVFGEIRSCKVMVDSQGRSKGTGFVSFMTAEAAHRAIDGMNGTMVGGKALYVCVAQRKDERRAFLIAHFTGLQNFGGATAPSVPQNFAPDQFFFGQVAPGLMPPPQDAGFGYQQYPAQHFIPGMGFGVPNIMMPYNMDRSPRHPSPRAGSRRRGFPQEMRQQQQQQQQMTHPNGNQSFGYIPDVRNGLNHAMVTSTSVPGNNNLTTALASADPDKQDQILGEKLQPLVEGIEPEHAGKVTGMLLELDKTEVLHLIESGKDLQDKVGQAMEALQHKEEGNAAAASAPSTSCTWAAASAPSGA